MDSSGAQLSLANKSSICFLYTLLPALRVAGVTPTVNLEFQIHLTCILLVCGRKLDNHTHRKAPGPGSNPQPSCCEATVLTAAPPSHPANLSQPTWYVSAVMIFQGGFHFTVLGWKVIPRCLLLNAFQSNKALNYFFITQNKEITSSGYFSSPKLASNYWNQKFKTRKSNL